MWRPRRRNTSIAVGLLVWEKLQHFGRKYTNVLHGISEILALVRYYRGLLTKRFRDYLVVDIEGVCIISAAVVGTAVLRPERHAWSIVKILNSN